MSGTVHLYSGIFFPPLFFGGIPSPVFYLSLPGFMTQSTNLTPCTNSLHRLKSLFLAPPSTLTPSSFLLLCLHLFCHTLSFSWFALSLWFVDFVALTIPIWHHLYHSWICLCVSVGVDVRWSDGRHPLLQGWSYLQEVCSLQSTWRSQPGPGNWHNFLCRILVQTAVCNAVMLMLYHYLYQMIHWWALNGVKVKTMSNVGELTLKLLIISRVWPIRDFLGWWWYWYKGARKFIYWPISYIK